MAQPSVNAKIAEFIENGRFADSDIFRDFDADEGKSDRRVYDIWNFVNNSIPGWTFEPTPEVL